MHKIIEILNADRNFGIGKQNGLLFRLPLDMAFFRRTTCGHVVVMGENTLLSFPEGKPLKDRVNVVLSADPDHNYQNVLNVHSLAQLYSLLNYFLLQDDVYIIGGASIYRQLLPFTNEVLLTKVDADGGAEVFFDNLDENDNFDLKEVGKPQLDNGLTIRFCTYENKSPAALPSLPVPGTKIEMTLYDEPFKAMQEGYKDIEMRLYDDKRKNLRVGDTIVFTNVETKETLTKTIIALAPFDSFKTIYESFPKARLGYKKNEDADPADMERYYTKESILRYGAFAIFLK